MEQIVTDIVNQFGYFGIFFLITLENIFPPIPSEIILTMGGFLTTVSSLSVIGVIVAATAGSLLGAIILYIVGRILNIERLERIVSGRLGKILHLKVSDIERVQNFFDKYGGKVIFFGRFVPLIRSLISIPAGMAKMRISVFLFLTFLGSLIWNTVLVILGVIAGNAWEQVAHYFDAYSSFVVLIIAIVCVTLVGMFVKKRFVDPYFDRNN